MQSINVLTPRKAVSQIEHVLKKRLVPFLHGSPGIGKSAIIKGIGERFNLELIDHRASTSEPTDFTGLPDLAGPKAVFKPFETFPIEGDTLPPGKDGWLIFLDEFNSAPRSVQAAAYKLILDRMVGKHKLHPRVLIVAAGNLETDRAITVELSTALQSRVVHFVLETNFNEWLEDVALPKKYDTRIIAFLNANPGYLMDFKPDHDDLTFCCPRTWEFMNELTQGLDNDQLKDFIPTFAGTITSLTAVSFVTFSQVFKDLPKIRDILGMPEHAQIPYDNATMWATVSMLLNHIDDKTIDPIFKYVGRMDAEFRILTYRSVMATQPDLHAHPAFRRAASELAQYLSS